MTPIAAMVRRMLEKGVDHEAILIAIEGAEEAIAANNSTGIPRNSAEIVAEKRRAWDRQRKRNSTGIPPDSTGIAEMPLSKSNLREEKREATEVEFRGNWRPDELDWGDAVAKLGLQIAEAELAKFNQLNRRIGAKRAVEWRVWIIRAVDWQAKNKPPPAPPASTASGFDWSAVVRTWMKTGYWSAQVGPDPESPACRCPREIIDACAAEKIARTA